MFFKTIKGLGLVPALDGPILSRLETPKKTRETKKPAFQPEFLFADKRAYSEKISVRVFLFVSILKLIFQPDPTVFPSASDDG